MKILIIGGTGTIGKAVVQELQKDDTSNIIVAGSSSGDIQVDIASKDSIVKMYKEVGELDAVVCAAARGVVFAPLAEMDEDKMIQSMQSKLLGQMNLVLEGSRYMTSNGSFTLTTGLLNVDPIYCGTAAAMVNGAIEGFAKAAAIDMPDKQRINVISPALLAESVEHYGAFFPGHDTVPAAKVSLAYRKSIFGKQTGQIYKVGW